jgi:hypothetical protein
MDAETQKDVEHLLDDQLQSIRRAYANAIKAGCADPVIWMFNLELEDSREVAIDIFGKRLREQLAQSDFSRDVTRSCLLATERRMAIETLAERLPSTIVETMFGTPQAPETIRVLVFYGGDIAAFDVP